MSSAVYVLVEAYDMASVEICYFWNIALCVAYNSDMVVVPTLLSVVHYWHIG